MKIRKVTIQNFRGISYAEINLEDFTTFIGPNNIGKSSILHALHILLNNEKPTIDDWPNKTQSAEIMQITCEFKDLEEWEKRKPSISGLLDGDSLKVRMSATWPEESTSISHEYSVFCTMDEFPWKNYTEAKKFAEVKECLQALNITSSEEFKQRGVDVENYIRDRHPHLVTTTTEWHQKKFANSLQQAVPHVMYVPACFKIEDDLKATNNSPFSFLFSNKLFPLVKNDATYREYIGKAADLQKKIQGKADGDQIIDGLTDALDQVSNTLNQILDFDSKVRLAVGDIEIEPLFMKAATFLIDEEFETSLQYQGSGVQRALAFAMLESNAEQAAAVEGGDRAVVVLYEEPELYIHPHLMRRLKSALVSKTSSPRWQVICSTHSPFLISLADKPESLKLIKRDAGNQRSIHQITADIFEKSGEYDERAMLRATLDFHPTVCESLFAKRVVLVEGDTEVAVFGMAFELLERFGLNPALTKDITVISAGGKWTIPAIAKILNTLGIDYKVIHDMDRKNLTDEELEAKAALHPFKANAKIASIAGAQNVYVVSDTFEHVLWDQLEGEQASSKDKPYNSWLRVRNFLDGRQDLTQSSKDTLKNILEFAFC
ncbi:ATP-dependent endonuclease [Pseudomonas sp. PDM15]|uniref:ATP-dependent nuclease n=1 Tax=Pseudomonas sp. PDM15 TaxID=2769303 RepID=UPI001783A626|nr:AAA family ATPase [Pseudomonas sp. PDM15]MBD9426716.1 ATP-dependent endonuclease [Pseudomonas sp. PDM15]